MASSLFTLLLVGTALASPLKPIRFGQELPVGYESFEADSAASDWTTFKNPIKTVAVIGAGPAGIQVAASLNEHNFTVRLFDRQDAPGGNWYYQDAKQVRESYPDLPLPMAAYTPETPGVASKLFAEGDEGLSLDERWREHTRPSPVWDSLHTNSPAVITELPGAPYPEDAPWVISAHVIQRHVRAFASIHSLNSNDRPVSPSAPEITSYATRVELLQKVGDKWTLSLRKLERVHDRIRVSWWTEEFDAVVVSTGGYDAAHVPEIKGLKAWSEVVRKDGSYPVWHSQAYRKPDALKGKNVLIVGASVSASEISRDLVGFSPKIYISVRNNTNRAAHFLNRSIRRIAEEAIHLADIAEFEPLPKKGSGIEGGRVRLANGTVLEGIDEVILATGFRRSNPFLRDYISNPEATSEPANAPILSPKGLTSLHWTGHYIPDPTLAFTNVRPWTVGRYQSLGFARVWAGLARIPNRQRLWEEYKGAEEDKVVPAFYGTLKSEQIFRQFVQWLNSEAFIHGGRFVDNWPVASREVFVYYAEKEWATNYITTANFTDAERTPFPKAGGHHGKKADGEDAFWSVAASEDLSW